MTFRSAAILPVSLAIALAGSFAVRADEIPEPCRYESSSVPEFVVDLRTGETEGKRRYGLRDQVRNVLRNKNPFAFDYRITVKETAIEEPGLAAFLTLSGLQAVLAPEDPSGDDTQKPVPPASDAEEDVADDSESRPPRPNKQDMAKALSSWRIPLRAGQLDTAATNLQSKKEALERAARYGSRAGDRAR